MGGCAKSLVSRLCFFAQCPLCGFIIWQRPVAKRLDFFDAYVNMVVYGRG